MKNYVAGFAFTPDKREVVLIQKVKPEWQNGKWNGVGGKIEPGEFAPDAMTREFQEETGLLIPVDKWRLFCNYIFDGGTVSFFSTVSDQLHLCKTMTEERVQMHRVKVLPNVIFNLNWLIPMARDTSVHLGTVYDSNMYRGK